MTELPRTRRTGVRDVARLAGVSPQTVSRVLNEYPGIRDETRARVREAMAALDYRVNNTARAFGTRTTRTLGLIASDATLFGPSIAIEALEAAARAVGRWVATVYADAANEKSVDEAARHLVSQGVDGIVVLAAHARTVAAVSGAAPGIPVRALHSDIGALRQTEGAALAVEHLLELGHRGIGRVRGPQDWLEGAAREAGVLRSLPADGPLWTGDWTAASGAALAPDIAAAIRAGTTAIVVANDQMALGVMAGLRGEGVEAPRDVSVTGFDDNPDAAFYSPALTTVRLDIAGEARRIVGDVLRLARPADIPAPPVLLIRGSTRANDTGNMLA